jgi:alpha-tubulin suppressor-like RCC1 family protein
MKAAVVLTSAGERRAVSFAGVKTFQLGSGRYSIEVEPSKAMKTNRGVQRGAIAYPERKTVVAKVAGRETVKVTVAYRAVVNPRVRPLPTRTLNFFGDPSSPTSLLLPYRGRPPTIGTIYISAPTRQLPRGLISKVTRVKKTRAGQLLSLVAVPITEAVPDLEFNGALELRPMAGESANRSARASASACSPPKLNKFKAHMDSFELRQASLSALPPQMRLTLAIRTTESLGLGAAAVGVNCDWTLAELGSFQGAIPVGPIVIPVYATVPVKVGAHINGKLDLGTINIASTTVASAAAGVSENSASLSLQGTNVWTSGVFALSGSAKLSASVGVQAGIGVAKGANVHFNAGFGPEFNWSTGHSCDLYLDLGTLSAGVTVLGKSLNTPGFTPLKPRLWSGCGGNANPGGGGGSGGGESGGGSGGGGGSVATTTYHASAEGPYTGPPPEANKPESPLLSVGYDYGCAIAVSKAVRCFGGDLDFFGASSVAGNFLQVSVGSVVSCGVRTDLTLACWGWVRPSDPSASMGPPPTGSFRSVSVGLVHICAVDTQYIMTCWGKEGNSAAVPHPGRYTQVSAGWDYTCGIHTDGTLDCWGEGPWGGSATPPSGTFREVSVGQGEACGLTYLNNVTCWDSSDGEIETHTGPFTGVDVSDGWACARQASGAPSCFSPTSSFNPDLAFAPRAGTYSDLSIGNPGACGRHDDGSVTCWGNAYAGQVTPAPGSFTDLMAGDFYTCGLRPDQSVSCWGDTDEEAPSQLAGSFLRISGGGRLNFGFENLCGIRTDHTLACHGAITPPGGTYSALAVTEYDGCAIATGSGSLSCWSTGSNPAPLPPTGEFTQVSGNGFIPWSRYCALRTDQTIVCWQSAENTLPPIAPPAGQFTEVSVGAAATDCGVRTDGTLSCWKPASYAGPSSPPAGTFVDVAVGEQAACAIRTGGSIVCWGQGNHGEANPPAGAFTQIVAGDNHMCARRSDHSVACWGHGDVLSAG